MHDPSPDTPNYGPSDRIWSQRPNQPKPSPADPALHDLVHDLDVAWDLPIPFALAGPPRGVQPRVEFTISGPLHPSLRRFFADSVISAAVHAMAVTEGLVCGCGGPSVRGGCSCPTCTPGGAR